MKENIKISYLKALKRSLKKAKYCGQKYSLEEICDFMSLGILPPKPSISLINSGIGCNKKVIAKKRFK